jgi:small subunit ribosomal protein S6
VREYELVLVVSPDVGDEGFPNTIDRVSKFIQDRGGEIKEVEPWGRRRLAYPITRFNEGFYAVYHFGLEPTHLRALEGNLMLAEDVLRHLVVKYEEVPPPPPRRGRFGAPAAAADGPPGAAGEVEPPPRRASGIGQDALVAAGEEPLAPPEDSPLSPREEAAVAADEEESASPLGEAPVAAEAGAEPEEPEAYVTTEPDAPADEPEGPSSEGEKEE